MQENKLYFSVDFELSIFDDKLIKVESRLRLPRRKGRPRKEDEDVVIDPFGELDKAADFVKEALSNGPRASLEIFVDAEEKGFSKKTIYRVGKLLGVQKWPVGHGHDQYWMWGILNGDNKQAVLAHDD